MIRQREEKSAGCGSKEYRKGQKRFRKKRDKLELKQKSVEELKEKEKAAGKHKTSRQKQNG